MSLLFFVLSFLMIGLFFNFRLIFLITDLNNNYLYEIDSVPNNHWSD